MKDYDYDSNPSPVYNNSDVKKIVIEDGVTSIGNFAFHSCSSLPSITIPDSVTSIGNFAFESCNSLSSITLSNNITSIGDAAFYDCSNLKSITIPDSVTSIESAVFYNCTSLKTISLSCKSSLKKSDFGDQSDLVSASHTLKKTEAKAATCSEDGNKEYWTCEYCGKYFLSDDANPETAKAVEQSECMIPAIQHKNATTRGALEPTETATGYSGDRYCPDCDKVVEKGYTYWIEGNLTWKLYEDGTLNISGTGAMKNYNNTDNLSPVHMNSSVKKIVIEEGVTSIGNSAFAYCRVLISITIPDSVTSIGEWAFDGCTSLPSITISSSVTSIEFGTFKDCSSLTSITIPDGVTSIGAYAFSKCSSLTSITIPDSVTSIKAYAAFNGCTSLKTISLSCGSILKRSDFSDQANLVSYTSHILTKTAAKAVTCTENGNKEYWTCEHCKKYFLSNDTNPETAKAVEQSEFIIPASHKLTKVEAKDATCSESGNKEYWTCEHCGKYFLSDDTNPETAKAVELSETITPALKHKNATTRGASKPDGTKPGYSGDRYCPDCDKVVEKGYTYWIEDNLTWKLYEDGTLNISGTGAMKNYGYSNNRSPVFWNTDVTSIVIEEGVTSIGNNAFYDCTSLTSVTIPGNVESIGESAFYYCDNLTDVTLQDGVKSIGDAAFIWCNNLTNIVLPNSVTSIGYYAFKDCTSLTSITIPDSVTSIGNDAFYNCSSLKTISLSCKSSLKRSNFGEQADLVSYTNQHILTKTAAKAATCTENGNKEYWTCEHCKKYFLSDDTNPETAKAVELSETVIPALVQVATTTTPIKCVYGQDMSKIDLRDYVKNTDVVGEVTVKVATDSTLPDGMKLDNGKISGKPAKAYEDGKEVTFTFTAENGNTANLTLLFLVAKADPTVEVSVSGDSHTEGDLVSELKLILSENSTKGVVELVSEIKALVAGKNTFTWKFMPEDENNYNMVTGTVVVNAQTTTTTTKPSKTTTTKATTTTKPSKTTTTNATTTNTAIPSYGDVNLDGKVDIVDAIFLNKYLATLIQFSDAQVANADCYQDGVLNDQDTTALMQFIILLIDDLPVQPTEK